MQGFKLINFMFLDKTAGVKVHLFKNKLEVLLAEVLWKPRSIKLEHTQPHL